MSADETRDRRQFVRGPRKERTSGPNYDAYASTGALRRHCPNCDAEPFTYCRRDGQLCKTPCTQRLSEKQA